MGINALGDRQSKYGQHYQFSVFFFFFALRVSSGITSQIFRGLVALEPPRMRGKGDPNLAFFHCLFLLFFHLSI